MIKFKSMYYTYTGVGIPLHFRIERLNRQEIIDNFYHPDERDSWCTHGDKPCPMFNTRPCCPPRVPVFAKLRPQKYLYAIHIRVFLSEFLEAYPQYQDSKAQSFFMSSIMRNACRKVLYEAGIQLRAKEDTVFKVGGCSSCPIKKGKPCKSCVSPALEGVGIDVSHICEHVFNSPINWIGGGEQIDYFTALGGLYTSQSISKSSLKEAINNVCKRFKR